MNHSIYIAIDLKSFYASVECTERHLDPLTTNLVVADESRTEKTICLAVSPSLKAHGIPGRARLFEVVQRVKELNALRLTAAIRTGHAVKDAHGRYTLASSSFDAEAIASDPSLAVGYIAAPPRMQTYMAYSTKIYNIYLKYVSPEDILVYSIDEVFIDVTHYLSLYQLTARELAMTIIREILYTTGITATGGIGTNMFLAKAAMDIVAKHVPADKDGVRIAELTEGSFREQLWTHEPLTDFWRIGAGTAKKLIRHGLYTLGDVARCSLGGPNDYYNQALLYKLFGVNAELLIDHAWGYEPTTIEQTRLYRPKSNSLSSGQVLHCPYPYHKTRLIVREMTDLLALDLVEKGLMTNQLVLTVGYDIECLKDPAIASRYKGPVTTDHFGRMLPKHAHVTIQLGEYTSSSKKIIDMTIDAFNSTVDPLLLTRRVTIAACNLLSEEEVQVLQSDSFEQLDLFTDYAAIEKEKHTARESLKKEKQLQKALLKLKGKYGKNAVLKGMNLEDGAMTINRNSQIGGHKA